MSAVNEDEDLDPRLQEPPYDPRWDLEPRWSLADRRALERAKLPGLASVKPSDKPADSGRKVG
jgi:hypothetical protein